MLGKPSKLAPSDNLTDFDCGKEALNRWLRERALANAGRGISQTFVVRAGTSVVGYYSLAGGAVYHEDAVRKVKGDAPDPVPVVVLARLAVDKRFQGTGLGAGLLKDAVLRARGAAESIGLRAMLVHANDDDAVKFYQKFGFRPSPTNPNTLMITLHQISRALGVSRA